MYSLPLLMEVLHLSWTDGSTLAQQLHGTKPTLLHGAPSSYLEHAIHQAAYRAPGPSQQAALRTSIVGASASSSRKSSTWGASSATYTAVYSEADRPRKDLSRPTAWPRALGKLRTLVTRQEVSSHVPALPAKGAGHSCTVHWSAGLLGLACGQGGDLVLCVVLCLVWIDWKCMFDA